jgi:hypothetical protein
LIRSMIKKGTFPLTSVNNFLLHNIDLYFKNCYNFNFSYSKKKAYGQSKLANILHANELSRRLQVGDRILLFL